MQCQDAEREREGGREEEREGEGRMGRHTSFTPRGLSTSNLDPFFPPFFPLGAWVGVWNLGFRLRIRAWSLGVGSLGWRCGVWG